MPMKARKIPQRQCIACRTQKPKRELLRIVRNPQGVLSFDAKGKVSGRGAYICASTACLQKAIKNKLFQRHLSADPDQGLVAQLQNLLGYDDPET